MTGLRARWARLCRRGERGGGDTLELVIVAPVVIVLILLVLAAVRHTVGSNRVEQAALVAVRAASLERDPDSARAAAAGQAAAALTDAGVTCADFALTVDTAAFDAAPGTPGTVEVTVRCTVDWSDLKVPVLPGSVTLSSTATAPLDVTGERA